MIRNPKWNTYYSRLSSILVFFGLFATSFSLPAQNNISIYGSGIDELASDICSVAGGGYAICGSQIDNSSPTSSTDLFALRLSAGGNILWQNKYSFPSVNFARIVATSDGGFFLGASRLSSSPNPNNAHDILATKLNSAGSIVWSVILQEVFNDSVFSVVESSNGSYWIGGASQTYATPQSTPSGDALLIQFDANTGQVISSQSMGSPSEDRLRKMISFPGGLSIAGSGVNNGSGMYIATTGLNGVPNVQRSLDSGANEWFEGIIRTTDGGFLACGARGTSNFRVLLVKFTASLGISWARQYGPSTGHSIAHQLIEHNGSYYLGGSTTSFSSPWDMFILKINLSGNLQWAHSYGETTGQTDFKGAVFAQGGSTTGFMCTNSYGSGSFDLARVDVNDITDSCNTDVTSFFSESSVPVTSIPLNITRSETLSSTPFIVSASPLNLTQQSIFCGSAPAPVPSLSQWGLIILLLLILNYGAITIWRKQYAQSGSPNNRPFDEITRL